ncbi:hypothetical protein [Dysgonomonas sp. HGC4]|uniref:hypothetical protein n=1 Tax=Dysgonomonas sp. HGC4 TaxID=1658009 RepID=UPI000B071EBF|nr:hypothetical protein [Dysgonomonas sp. HGC4]MBD8346788.1 hypothetical protein [Dysgonomonas sp. HGC4]
MSINIMPSDSRIEEVITLIQNCMKNKSMNRSVNIDAKEGYAKALEILISRENSFVKSGAGKLKSLKGQSIAYHAINYIKGECDEKVLLSNLVEDTNLK